MTDRRFPPRSRYRLFGAAVDSDIELNLDTAERDGNPDLRISEHHGDYEAADLLVDSPYRTPDGEGRYRVFNCGGRVLLELRPYAIFLIGRHSIEYRRMYAGSHAGLKVLLTGVVAAIWAEVRGWPTLHGSAVRVGNGAAVFLAPSRIGKSSFAAAWVRDGHELLADDQVVLQTLAGVTGVAAGPPHLKVSALLARFLGADYESLPLLHPNLRKRQFVSQRGQSAGGVHPVAAVFVLRRSTAPNGDAMASALLGADSVLPLLRNGYSPQTVEALGLHTSRLKLLARLAQDVPVWRLTYPTGYAHLPRVRQLALQCLAKQMT